MIIRCAPPRDLAEAFEVSLPEAPAVGDYIIGPDGKYWKVMHRTWSTISPQQDARILDRCLHLKLDFVA